MSNPFFNNHGPFKIADILQSLNLKSDEMYLSEIVNDIKNLLASNINDVTFFHSKKYKDLAITTKAKNYNFTDRLAKEYSGSIKSIIPSIPQDFSCRINQDNGLLETKGMLVEKIRKLINSGDLHNFDISLFWGSLRTNVKDRINAFI